MNGMPLSCRLKTRAVRGLACGVWFCVVASLAGLGLAGCDPEPDPRVPTPSPLEVEVMEAAQEAAPTPTAVAVEAPRAERSGTAAPAARTPVQTRTQPTAAAPVARARPTPSATPTPSPQRLDDEAISARLAEAADLIERVTGSPAAMRAGADLRAPLEGAVLAFLDQYGADPEAAVRLDYTIGQLPPLVYDLDPDSARVSVADVDGDGANELIAAWHILGVPPVWFDQVDEGFAAREFPVGVSAGPWSGMSVVHSTADLTDDGVADVVLISMAPGASTQTETVRVYAWNGDSPRRVFDVPVVLGVGPAGWTIRDGGSAAEIETVCPALGHFDAPLLPHPALSRTFAWAGQHFAEVARRLDAPVSVHDQINRGEAAYWAGRYPEAEVAYRAVIERPVSNEGRIGRGTGLGGAGVSAAGSDLDGRAGGV